MSCALAMFCAFLLTMTACSSEPNDTGSSEELPLELSKTIGPEGGSIAIQGAKLSVPMGALKKPTKLTLASLDSKQQGQIAAVPKGISLVSTPTRFTPHGMIFEKEVSIELEHQGKPSKLKAARLANEEDSTWESMNGVTVGETKLGFQTKSFSIYAAAADPEDLLPEPVVTQVLPQAAYSSRSFVGVASLEGDLGADCELGTSSAQICATATSESPEGSSCALRISLQQSSVEAARADLSLPYDGLVLSLELEQLDLAQLPLLRLTDEGGASYCQAWPSPYQGKLWFPYSKFVDCDSGEPKPVSTASTLEFRIPAQSTGSSKLCLALPEAELAAYLSYEGKEGPVRSSGTGVSVQEADNFALGNFCATATLDFGGESQDFSLWWAWGQGRSAEMSPILPSLPTGGLAVSFSSSSEVQQRSAVLRTNAASYRATLPGLSSFGRVLEYVLPYSYFWSSDLDSYYDPSVPILELGVEQTNYAGESSPFTKTVDLCLVGVRETTVEQSNTATAQ